MDADFRLRDGDYIYAGAVGYRTGTVVLYVHANSLLTGRDEP
jgi:hypothetical protein